MDRVFAPARIYYKYTFLNRLTTSSQTLQQEVYKVKQNLYNAIFAQRTLTARTLNMQKTYLYCLTGKVKHGEIMKILEDIHTEGRDLRIIIIKDTYWNQETVIREDNMTGKYQPIKEEIRPNCDISQDVFSL